MKTTVNNSKEMIQNVITISEKNLEICTKEIEHLTHPEIYGCCLSRCNSIVINKERMMTVTTDSDHMTTYEFTPIYPTYFSPEAARRIVDNDIYKDANGNRIKMEIIGKLDYYRLLKAYLEKNLNIIKSVMA